MCNYNKRHTRAELEKVVAKWSKWADGTSSVPCRAWIMTPIFAPANMPVDVVWPGAWQNGTDLAAFGASWEGYVNGQGWRKSMQMAGGFLECGSPRVYYSTTVRDGGINPRPR